MAAKELYPNVVHLNVGGRHFTTLLSTLTKETGSWLADLFNGRHPVHKDQDGRFFIDADADTFLHILNFLRMDYLPPADIALPVYKAAVFFGLKTLAERLTLYATVQRFVYLEKNAPKCKNYDKTLIEVLQKIQHGYNLVILKPNDRIHNLESCQLCKDGFKKELKVVIELKLESKETETLVNLIINDLRLKGYNITVAVNNTQLVHHLTLTLQ